MATSPVVGLTIMPLTPRLAVPGAKVSRTIDAVASSITVSNADDPELLGGVLAT
jgi:hypothetical protein